MMPCKLIANLDNGSRIDMIDSYGNGQFDGVHHGHSAQIQHSIAIANLNSIIIYVLNV